MANEVHEELRAYWHQRYDREFPPKLLQHLSRLLFMKRKQEPPHDAGASQPDDMQAQDDPPEKGGDL